MARCLPLSPDRELMEKLMLMNLRLAVSGLPGKSPPVSCSEIMQAAAILRKKLCDLDSAPPVIARPAVAAAGPMLLGAVRPPAMPGNFAAPKLSEATAASMLSTTTAPSAAMPGNFAAPKLSEAIAASMLSTTTAPSAAMPGNFAAPKLSEAIAASMLSTTTAPSAACPAWAATARPADRAEIEDDNFSTECGPQSSCSGDGVRSFGSSAETPAYTQDGSSPGGEALVFSDEASSKSIGSLSHPDRCTECQFFFFAPGGCKNGASCRYCHELHPRQSAKKTRRMLRRIQARDNVPEGVATPAKDKEVMAMDMDMGQAVSQVSLRYPVAPGPRSEARMTFAVGQEVKLPALLEGHKAARKVVLDSLRYRVEPPLPSGLELDSRSGEIAGTPFEGMSRQTFTVTVCTQATGPRGINLGLVPLATCELSVRVVDLRSCRPCVVSEKESGVADFERLEVEFVPCLDS